MARIINKIKPLDHKDRPWHWSDKKWADYCEEIKNLFGFIPTRPAKPNPDDEVVVMLNVGLFRDVELKYLRDMVPADSQRINAYLPTKNQLRKQVETNQCKQITKEE